MSRKAKHKLLSDPLDKSRWLVISVKNKNFQSGATIGTHFNGVHLSKNELYTLYTILREEFNG